MKKDLVIIGAGPAGLAAAIAAKQSGIENLVVLDRNSWIGGVLNQCIHEGFGLFRFKKSLTGPQYAEKYENLACDNKVDILNNTAVFSLSEDKHILAMGREGLLEYDAKSVVLATGCRERTRGNLLIQGSRPAGIYTAGAVQNLVNLKNILPGKKIVILGSGDIGLIIARRLVLRGLEVKAVIEVKPEPGGLQRNVQNCLYNYNIPLLVKHTVSRVVGKRRIEGVEIVSIDTGEKQLIDCDTLILSVGLIPENELAKQAGVSLLKAGEAETDDYLMTNLPGVFSCGNSRSVADLVDFVSEEAEIAGINASAYLTGSKMSKADKSKANTMPKGFPPQGVICTKCPKGCRLTIIDDEVFGNECSEPVKHV